MADDFFKKTGNFLKKGSQFLSDKINLDITHLIEAVNKNDAEMVERCVVAGIDPNMQDGINRRALPLAVDNVNPTIVKILLLGKANPNLPNKDKESAIFKAASWDNFEIAKLLLEAGADVNQQGTNGSSALEEAQRKGFSKMVDLLQNFKAEKKAEQKAEQVADDKATHEDLKAKAEEAKRLREQKQAAAEKQKAIKEQQARESAEHNILKKYQAAEKGNLSALIAAIQHEDEAAADLFIQKIDNPNEVDAELKTTPLLVAISQKNTKAVISLLEKGANPLQVVDAQHHSGLTLAVSMNAHKLVQFILDKSETEDAEILNAPSQPLSPTFLAYKDAKMLNLLLAAGADPYFGGKDGRSPVVKAVEKASIGILPVLAKHKVDLNRPTEGKTPLEWAIHFNREDWVIGLLEEGVQRSLTNSDGQTPLEFAKQIEGRESIVLVLENSGSDEEE